MINEYRCQNREQLIRQLTEYCIDALQSELAEHDKTALLVSGGSTPGPLYANLATTDLPWSKIQVALVDERWVDPGHEASNEALIRRTLLQERAAEAEFLPMKNGAATPAEGLAECEACYRRLVQPFAVTLLGMGNDGHTASLFPHAEGLDEALRSDSEKLCAAITAQPSEVTGSNIERMSLSLNGLLASRRLALMLTGDAKWEVYQKAKAGGAVEDMPIRALLNRNDICLDVFWAP